MCEDCFSLRLLKQLQDCRRGRENLRELHLVRYESARKTPMLVGELITL